MDIKPFNTKLIIGLGNPGKEYSYSFHNAGFMLIDYLRENSKDKFEIANKKNYELTTFPGKNLKLLKPLTFMNNSGQVIAEFLKYNEYKPEEILIAFDDLDIEFGEYKLQHGKFPKSHNGINSIQNATGETNYLYFRIGIETRDEKRRLQQSGEDYVLSKLSKQQKDVLESVFKKTDSLLEI